MEAAKMEARVAGWRESSAQQWSEAKVTAAGARWKAVCEGGQTGVADGGVRCKWQRWKGMGRGGGGSRSAMEAVCAGR
jgi:hypothetical protein